MALTHGHDQHPRGPHLSGYAARDHEVIDYRMAELPATGLMFRGPLPALETGRFVVCLGAAQNDL